jgi:hypothetical protein
LLPLPMDCLRYFSSCIWSSWGTFRSTPSCPGLFVTLESSRSLVRAYNPSSLTSTVKYDDSISTCVRQ